MSVDPSKPRKILIVHGVQTKTDADINPHLKIKELVQNRLSMPFDFDVETYKYENIADRAQGRLQMLLGGFIKPLTDQVPLGGLAGKVVHDGVDLVGDVLLALKDGTTAATIRKGLRQRIEEIFEAGNPLYLLAHSLGTVYALDVVNELVRDSGYFERDRRRTWPVQGLVTMGSPLGLSMFKRHRLASLGDGRKHLRWINYYDRTDPVVSGSFYGKPLSGYQVIEERFAFHDEDDRVVDRGWHLRDRIVDTGKVWLMAHVGYWTHAGLGDDLVDMITN